MRWNIRLGIVFLLCVFVPFFCLFVLCSWPLECLRVSKFKYCLVPVRPPPLDYFWFFCRLWECLSEEIRLKVKVALGEKKNSDRSVLLLCGLWIYMEIKKAIRCLLTVTLTWHLIGCSEEINRFRFKQLHYLKKGSLSAKVHVHKKTKVVNDLKKNYCTLNEIQ